MNSAFSIGVPFLKGLKPTIKHNISKAPADLVIEWNSILHETGEKLTKVLLTIGKTSRIRTFLEQN